MLTITQAALAVAMALSLPLAAAADRPDPAAVLADQKADPIARRQAFRQLCAGKAQAARAWLQDPDAEIRLGAYYLIARQEGEAAIETLAGALQDPSVDVRKMAVSALVPLAQSNRRASELLTAVSRDESVVEVRQIADKAIWPFHRDVKLLRQDPDWDHEVAVVHRFDLPEEDWRIALDPQQKGHKENWFAEAFNDQAWKKIKVGHWEQQEIGQYDGVAWYRIRFRMPEKIDSNAVELAFGGVDESAWVWLNGTYLGSHDLGEVGWNQPFALDCRHEIRWGAENILVVRVYDSAAGGGIWKPIAIEVLK